LIRCGLADVKSSGRVCSEAAFKRRTADSHVADASAQGAPSFRRSLAVDAAPGASRAEPNSNGVSPEFLLKRAYHMFLGLAVVLLVLWLLGFLAFHVAGGLIHLLILFAVISFVVHFMRGRTSV
jgi:hypothetical protein